MARNLDKCRHCRREGEKLFLKGEKCFTDKCPVERRGYAPGQHGQRSGARLSDYGKQLREKQKVRHIYGLLERQFRKTYAEAARSKGVTGERLLQQLETRLDNVTYRLGFALSRRQARQLVRHGHIEVNGRKVNIPSYEVKAGDEIAVRERSRKAPTIVQALEFTSHQPAPNWLDVNREALRGRVTTIPKREDINLPINEQLIVELYSK